MFLLSFTRGDRPNISATFAASLCVHVGLGNHAFIESLLLLAVAIAVPIRAGRFRWSAILRVRTFHPQKCRSGGCALLADRRIRSSESPREQLRGGKVPRLFTYPGGRYPEW